VMFVMLVKIHIGLLYSRLSRLSRPHVSHISRLRRLYE